MRMKIYTCVTVIITLILVYGTILQVSGSESRPANIVGGIYEEPEDRYIKDISSILDESGYTNCGITLDKVTSGHDGFVYTLSIHHRRFEKLDSSRKAALQAALSDVYLDVNNSEVYILFIE